MTQPTFTLDLVRSLRGSPLTCLIAIVLLEQSGQIPVTAQLLKDVTGYKDHTITDSLRMLTLPTCQIVVRVAGGWRLASGFQLPLEIQSQNREYRGFEPVNAVNAVMVESKTLLEDSINNRTENRDIRGFLHSVGIQEPKAGRLAKLEWVTREYVSAHVAAIELESWEHPQGMLIHRLENKYPAPEVKRNSRQSAAAVTAIAAKFTGHETGCYCEDCSMIRLAGNTDILCPDCRHYHCECSDQGATTP
jgi:hypothetical protein